MIYVATKLQSCMQEDVCGGIIILRYQTTYIKYFSFLKIPNLTTNNADRLIDTILIHLNIVLSTEFDLS